PVGRVGRLGASVRSPGIHPLRWRDRRCSEEGRRLRTALIGHTGFVGSNFASAYAFDDVYNTSNIAEIAGQEYDLVVSAAARADSHRINNHGHEDRTEIDAYVDLLSKVRIGKLVLASTVCIYPGDTSPDEATPLTEDDLTP